RPGDGEHRPLWARRRPPVSRALLAHCRGAGGPGALGWPARGGGPARSRRRPVRIRAAAHAGAGRDRGRSAPCLPGGSRRDRGHRGTPRPRARAGALPGEVAYLAGEVPKALLFRGGAATIAGWDETTASPERLARPATPAEQVARDALVESAVKTAVALATAVPAPKEFVLSGRLARVEPLARAIRERLEAFAPTRLLEGFTQTVKEGAQGAALIADGLAGGAN